MIKFKEINIREGREKVEIIFTDHRGNLYRYTGTNTNHKELVDITPEKCHCERIYLWENEEIEQKIKEILKTISQDEFNQDPFTPKNTRELIIAAKYFNDGK